MVSKASLQKSSLMKVSTLVAAWVLLLVSQSTSTNAFHNCSPLTVKQTPAFLSPTLSLVPVVATTPTIHTNSAVLLKQTVNDNGNHDDNDNDGGIINGLTARRTSRRKFMNKAMEASGMAASGLTFGMFLNLDPISNNNLNMNQDHPIGCTCPACQYGPHRFYHARGCQCDSCDNIRTTGA